MTAMAVQKRSDVYRRMSLGVAANIYGASSRRPSLLTHPTLDQMHQFGLTGMARALAELEANPRSADLSASIGTGGRHQSE